MAKEKLAAQSTKNPYLIRSDKNHKIK